jgi:hypothetical protein
MCDVINSPNEANLIRDQNELGLLTPDQTSKETEWC